ncbi:MAG: AIR synthase-related protein [Bacteroidia bacterium]|nr:AIR synthase-related protein [Bacteroidia bacterium]
MSELNGTAFTIDQIPEPDDLRNVIYSMIAIPHLSPVNIFNEFSPVSIDSNQIGKDDLSGVGVFEADEAGNTFSQTIYVDYKRLAIDPFVAAQIIVAKAVRRLICNGAEPIAMSAFINNVDFASPLAEEMVTAARLGLNAAATAFNLQFPNSKIYYEHANSPVAAPPTLIVSLVGKIITPIKHDKNSLKKKGNHILLIGRSANDINASEYLSHIHEVNDTPLMPFNLSFEHKLMTATKELIKNNLVVSASPVGMGGLFFTLLRDALPHELGFDITTDAEIRTDAFLFGEAMGRIVVSVEEEKENDFVDFLYDQKIPVMTLGHVTKGEIRIDDQSLGFVDKGIVGEYSE